MNVGPRLFECLEQRVGRRGRHRLGVLDDDHLHSGDVRRQDQVRRTREGAAGGGVESRELTLETLTATRTRDDALNGFLPQTFNQVVYMRDWPVLPAHATVLAIDNFERPAVWQVGENAFGFSGNPGIKLGMVEDLIMEFEEVPDGAAERLDELRALQVSIEDELVPIMTGLVQCTALMSTPKAAAQAAKSLDTPVI